MGCHSGKNSYLQGLSENKEQYLAYESDEKVTWCGGCGNYGIQNALKRALTLEGLGVKDVLFCFDIGCNGNGSDKIFGYTIHGLHGRVISLGAGCALANSKMKVIASAGDGATMSEGINHLIHAVRSDYPMVFLLHNNQNYGLTTGQASATTRKGERMNASPDGVTNEPMNPSELVLMLGASFVARTFSADPKHMTKIFQEAITHKGFAFVEVMQVCPTYNKATPSTWFWERMKYTCDIKGYDPTNLKMAREVSADIYEQLAVGVLYNDEKMPNFVERLDSRKGKETTLVEEVSHYNVGNLLKRFE